MSPASAPAAVRVFAGGFCAAAVLLVLLAGCAAPGTELPAAVEPRTASDQTDNDRRARVRLELASAYFSRGQLETALDEVKLALLVRPDMAEGYNLRGLIYGSMGQDQLADESFRRALQLNPRDADAMHNYAWFMCQQKRYADGDQLFRQALAQPQYRDNLRSLLAQGVCQARAGNTDEAERTLTRAYEGDPSNPNVAFNLAEVLYQRGELERARFYVRRINQQAGQSNAQTLWLAVKIERRLGNAGGVDDYGRQLRNRFPQAPQTLALERGRFDD